MEDALKSDIALDTYDVIKKIGAPGAYTDERRTIIIENYIGEIPTDLLYIKEVNYLLPGLNGVNVEVPMQYVIGNKTSVWHCSGARDLKIRSEYGYSINPGKIHTDLENGKLAIYYKSVLMDEDGFPLIPDVPGVVDAIVAYAKMRHFQIKSDLGLLAQNAVSRVEQDYYFAMGQAETTLKMPSPDEYKSIARSMLRIIRDLEYKE
jgi:hypothetical protein